MMELIDNFIAWLIANKTWVFSGAGVAIIGAIVAVNIKEKLSKKTVIKTSGDISPGYVGGDFKGEIKNK